MGLWAKGRGRCTSEPNGREAKCPTSERRMLLRLALMVCTSKTVYNNTSTSSATLLFIRAPASRLAACGWSTTFGLLAALIALTAENNGL